MTVSDRWRSLAAIISASFGVGMMLGAIVPLITLRLEAQGVEAFWIGVNAAMVPLAIILAGPFIPRLMARLGTLGSVYTGIFLFAATVPLFPLLDDYWLWCALRFLAGLSAALHWIASETWMNLLATERNRGRVMGIYTAVMSAGMAVGPVIVGWTGIEGWSPFLAVLAAVGFSALPLPFARGLAPVMPPHRQGALGLAMLAVPVVLVASLAGGLADAAIFTLLPLYALDAGQTQQAAVLMLAVFTAGNLALPWPLGWLADHTDRGLVLRACVMAVVLGALLLPFVIGSAVQWVHLFLWGGTVFGMYGLSLGLLGARVGPERMAAANAAFVIVYATGSGLGPVIGGAAMDTLGRDGLPAIVVVGMLAFLAFDVFFRRR